MEVFCLFFYKILGILYGYNNINATFLNNTIHNSSALKYDGGLNIFYTVITVIKRNFLFK